MRPIFLALALAAAAAMSSAAVEPAMAAAKKCKANQSFVAKWGCVKKSEIAKAKRICSKLKPPAPFTECLCQDGKVIGACGD